MCTRLLLTVIPAAMYVGDRTMDSVLQAIVEDLNALQSNGLEVPYIAHRCCSLKVCAAPVMAALPCC